MMQPERPILKKLVRSWLIQGIGWYARDEIVARVLLEGGFLLSFVLLREPVLVILLAWLAFHTAAWFVLYGGFLRTWVVLGVATDTDRLKAYLGRLAERVRRQPSLSAAFLRGSGARGELGPRSDLDVCMVPVDRFGARVRGILFLWSVRAGALLARKPVEARWIDFAKEIPYHVIEETPVFLKVAARVSPRDALATRGLFLAFSGIDGSGKTSAAKDLVAAMQGRGIDAVYFYGHRQPWFRGRRGYNLSLAIVFESLWKRIGRTFPDLEGHRLPRTVYALTTALDYVSVRFALERTMRGSRIVVADRYVADVIAYLRSWGPLFTTVEGFLVGLSLCPDLAVLFDVGPEEALRRKGEWDVSKLNTFLREYADLAVLLGLRHVDAGGSPEHTRGQVQGLVREELGPVV